MNVQTVRNFRPVFVLLGFTVAILFFNWLAKMAGIQYLSQFLGFLPNWLIPLIGLFFILAWVPIFVFGLRGLGVPTAKGRGDKLVTSGLFQHVRNPMYAGATFTIFGFGLISGVTGVVASALLGIYVASLLAKQEEKTLTEKYGVEYLGYKQKTPAFIPNFAKLFKAIFTS